MHIHLQGSDFDFKFWRCILSACGWTSRHSSLVIVVRLWWPYYFSRNPVPKKTKKKKKIPVVATSRRMRNLSLLLTHHLLRESVGQQTSYTQESLDDSNPEYRMPSREAIGTIFKFFGMTQPVIEPITFQSHLADHQRKEKRKARCHM